jgi:magnesium transporter
MKPEKIILQGLQKLTNINLNLYSNLKSEAKAKPEITFIGEKKVEAVQSQLFIYNADSFKEITQLKHFGEFEKHNDGSNVLWLNFYGLHDTDLFEALGRCIGIERFTLRQIVDTTQRPKVEEYDHYLFFSVKSISIRHEQLHVEQLSFLLGNTYLISFQEEKGDHFGHIRNKIRENLGVIRKKGSDYLLAQLLDAILDNYFETLDSFRRNMSLLGETTLSNPKQAILLAIEDAKKSGELIKKSLMPTKEALTNILNDRTTFICKTDKKYFRDLKNSCSSALEEVDSAQKSLEGLTNIYFSSLSQKMNDIMKVLTTVATIFIPLTFIAGIYGMNFEYMPGLNDKSGYFIVLGIMFLVLVGMLIYFKVKKWI